MSKITEIDKNFSFKTKIKEDNIVFFNVEDKPFDLYGVKKDCTVGKFTRMPLDVAKEVNDGVHALCTNTSGGRIRFKTDSPYLAIRCKIPVISLSSNMAISGTAGFDLYTCENGNYKLESAKFRITSGIVGYWIDVDINLFKNGKQLHPNKYLSRVKYTYYGKSYWSDWGRGNEDHAYHRYVILNHAVKVKKVQVKY